MDRAIEAKPDAVVIPLALREEPMLCQREALMLPADTFFVILPGTGQNFPELLLPMPDLRLLSEHVFKKTSSPVTTLLLPSLHAEPLLSRIGPL